MVTVGSGDLYQGLEVYPEDVIRKSKQDLLAKVTISLSSSYCVKLQS